MDKKFTVSRLFCFFLLFVAESVAFSQTVLNPSKGTWANRQILVLDVPQGMNAYYSVSGNDPESSGFAYDGPVLLDVDGDVSLRVAFVSGNGRRHSQTVLYTVDEASAPKDLEAFSFVEGVVSRALVDYTAGEEFAIPSSLEYSFGSDGESFEAGKTVSIPSDSVLVRLIPCTVTDGKSRWRFVVRVNPAGSGLFGRRDVPFVIEDWEKLTFTDMRFIYKIDDQWWDRPKIPVTLDRSVSHMISWQRVDYSAENPVRFFVLPPRPEIISLTDGAGARHVSASGGAGYKFGIIDSDGDVSELYDSLRFDTFQGDAFSGSVKSGIYYDSVYQGEMKIDFAVNRRLPSKPEISSTAENGWARKPVTVNIKKTPLSNLFVCVQGPVVVEEGKSSGDLLFSFMEKDFQKVMSGKLVLNPSSDGAVAYKVSAYVVDSNGNRSRTAEYSVVIDTCNYYVDAALNSTLSVPADGTRERPFGSYSDIKTYADSSRFVRIYLDGEMPMPDSRTLLLSNMEIIGGKDARISFPEKSSLVVRDSSLAVSDCLVVHAWKDAGPREAPATSLFTVERGVLLLDSVELSAAFGKNGTVIDSENSVVTVKNSGLTASAQSYSSIIASVDSKISIRNSRLAAVSSTGVLFSCQGGLFELRKNSCSVVGVMGRVAELFNTHSSITDNEFSAELKKSSANANPIYMDAKNLSVENSGNSSSGF